MSLPVHERPATTERFHNAELPDTPQRTFRIPGEGWIEAPASLLSLGDEIGEPTEYKRRIGTFLLWRAGPPVGEARYLAIGRDDLAEQYRFGLSGKTGTGIGADGQTHQRFRSWKESLLEASDNA